MKQLRNCITIGSTLGLIILLSVISTDTYASGMPQASPVRSLTSDSRAFLALSPGGSSQLDPLSHFRASKDESSLEAFASRVSFFGGLLLTADRVFRSVDSAMEAPLIKSEDGSVLRVNAEPTSGGFLLGFHLSRPLDF